MAKLPAPASVAHLQTLTPATIRVAAGSALARISFGDGPHPAAWNSFRYWGPAGSRFNHHLLDAAGNPHFQSRGVLYAAKSAQTCLAEVFQETRVVDVQRQAPYLVVWDLAADLVLLDLTGPFATRMGASTAIHSGPRARTRPWAAALYEAYPDLDGIAYCSSMNGNAISYALNERAQGKGPFPTTPSFIRPLADPYIADLIDEAANVLGYLVKR